MRRTLLSLILLASFVLSAPRALANAVQSSISADEFPSEVASSWFELLYDVVPFEVFSQVFLLPLCTPSKAWS